MAYRRTNVVRAGSPGSRFQTTAFYDLEGLKNVRRMLTGHNLVDIIIRNMKVVEGTAIALCPVDTGALRATIKLEVVEQSQLRVIVRLTAGSETVYYAPYVEFGTARTAAQPFMRPAWEQWSDEVKRNIAQDIAQILKTGTGNIFKRR